MEHSKVNGTVVFHQTLILYALRLGVRLVRFVMCCCMFCVSVILDRGLSLVQSSKELSGHLNAKTCSFSTYRNPSAQRLWLSSTGTRGVSDSARRVSALLSLMFPCGLARQDSFIMHFKVSYSSETLRTGMVSSAVQGPHCRGSGWL